jgi:hypothetical protein
MSDQQVEGHEALRRQLEQLLASHPRLRQVALSGITAAVVAELARLGLQDKIDSTLLTNLGRLLMGVADSTWEHLATSNVKIPPVG